jgi:hypothetical protein
MKIVGGMLDSGIRSLMGMKVRVIIADDADP